MSLPLSESEKKYLRVGNERDRLRVRVADLEAENARLQARVREAEVHGCQDCAYEFGVPLPGPTGLCPKHADEQIDGRHSERRRRVEAIERGVKLYGWLCEAYGVAWKLAGYHAERIRERDRYKALAGRQQRSLAHIFVTAEERVRAFPADGYWSSVRDTAALTALPEGSS